MQQKKFLLVIIALLTVMLFALTACNDNSQPPNLDDDFTSEVSESEDPSESDLSVDTSEPETTDISNESETTDDTSESETTDDTSESETTDDTSESETTDDTDNPDDPSYDETPACVEYWRYEPSDELGKLVKVSCDENGNIHLIEKYPLLSEFIYNNSISQNIASLDNINYNDPFGIATEKAIFNYKDGNLVSMDYYYLPRNHLGVRAFELGYTTIFEESTDSLGNKCITTNVFVNRHKTRIQDTYLFDSNNNEILLSSSIYSSKETVYDMSGRLIAIRGNRDGSTFEYGSDGHIQAVRYWVTGWVEKEILFTFTEGKLTSLTYTDQEETNFATLSYDTEGRFIRADIEYTNSEILEMNAQGTCSVTYDAQGRVQAISLANARDGETVTRTYTYTDAGYFSMIRDVATYVYSDKESELITITLTYQSDGKPSSITRNGLLGTITSEISYDAAGNLTYDGNYTYEYYANGNLKKKSNETGYTVYYENGLPKESQYPGVDRSTITNYFDKTDFNFAFQLKDLYFGKANETSSLMSYAKKTICVEADGTTIEYIRTFDEEFNVIDTVTTVTPPNGETPPSDDPPAEHNHDYTKSEITTPATCVLDGVLTKYCSCGEFITAPIKAKGHKYLDESIVIEPTCTDPGQKRLSCSCGEYITHVIDPLDHRYDDHSQIIDPGCEQPGEITLYCFCGAFISEIIEPIGHEITDQQLTLEPTCDTVGKLTLYCARGCTITEDIEANGHYFYDWSTLTEPTCQTEGELIRSCEICQKIEYASTPTIDHNYRKILEVTNENGQATVTLICEMCDTPAGNTYQGSYIDTNEIFYLTDQPTDFSFEIVSELDAYEVGLSVTIVDVYYWGNYEKEHEYAIETVVNQTENGRYVFSPARPLEENTTYAIIIYDDRVRFADMPGNAAILSTTGEAVNHVEYNDNVLFLNTIAQSQGVPYACSLEYNEEYDLYVLVIPSTYQITESYVGKILCVGNCQNFDEASALPTDEVFFGKIEAVFAENESTIVALSIPSVMDIYSKIEVSGAKIEDLGDDIVTEEVEASMIRSVVESDDFASAIAAANISARNYAADHFATAYTSPRGLNLDNFDVKHEVTQIDDNVVKIALYITYTHVVDLYDGDIKLGYANFTISFEISNTFTLDVNTNLSEYFSDTNTPMLFMQCEVSSTTLAAFDMTANITMNYSEPDEALFIVNLKSQKIHRSSCKHCPKLLSDNYAAMTLSELAARNPHYKNYECKVCRPFSLDSSTFYINRESWVVHVGSCFYLTDMNADNYLAYSVYPVGKGVKNCTACHPEQYTKTLAEHIADSLEDKDFDQAFEAVKKATGDLLSGGGESPIDQDATPKIMIPIACFEVPIYIEPKFDFDLKADFKLHCEVSVVNTTMLALIYRDGDYSIISDYHSGEPVAIATVDIMGELDIELGVVSEIRFGLRYLSKHVYIGLMMDVGTYLDAGGVFSYSSTDNLAYYAASLELGMYAEVRCTYAIIGLISADSFNIIDKTHFPVFNSGDKRVYFRYDNIEESMDIVNIKKLWLDNTYLMCNYYDLQKMEILRGSLSWKGSEQYRISCTFRDENGNVVDYITFENGAILILDHAPDSFTVYMTVTVEDKIVYDSFAEYFGTANKNGYAIFLPEKVIEIHYSYTDTTEEMQNALDVYKGTYTFGTDLFGTVLYRNLTIGVHSTEDLCANEGMLNAYAIFATYTVLDDNNNPVKVYTADDIRSIILNMGCEYVMIMYATPGNHYNDNGYEFKIVQAYWNNGLLSNSANQSEIASSSSGSFVYLDLGIPNEEGMFGGVYADETLTESIGEFELFRMSENQEAEPENN